MNPLSQSFSPWGAPLLTAALGTAVALLALEIGTRLIARAASDEPMTLAIMRAIKAPARLLLPLLAVAVSVRAGDEVLPGEVMVARLIAMAAIGALAWLLVRALQGYARAVTEAHPVDQADNLDARRIHTQTKVLVRIASGVIVLAGTALVLMTIPAVRQLGASLLASAGVIGIVAGFAARPVLGNMIAGLQIGLTQPIRISDVVIVEGEWGVIEEITGAYVVVRIWDERRLVVPLQYWVENPFQNWTRSTSQLIGTVTMWLDYRMPLAPLREALQRACEGSPAWDRRLALLQVTEAGEHAIQIRALVTAGDASRAWDLRCHVREALVDFVQREYPQYLPRLRLENDQPPPPPAP